MYNRGEKESSARFWVHRENPTISEAALSNGRTFYCQNIKYACTNEKGSTCEYCNIHKWTGPAAELIPQPKPDEDNSGHCMPVCVTPTFHSNGKMREVDDYQPRVFITSLFNKGEISLDDKDAIEETARKIAIDEVCVISCIEHLRDLSINKESCQEGSYDFQNIANCKLCNNIKDRVVCNFTEIQRSRNMSKYIPLCYQIHGKIIPQQPATRRNNMHASILIIRYITQPISLIL